MTEMKKQKYLKFYSKFSNQKKLHSQIIVCGDIMIIIENFTINFFIKLYFWNFNNFLLEYKIKYIFLKFYNYK